MSPSPARSAARRSDREVPDDARLHPGVDVALRLSGVLPYRLLGAPLSRHVVERNVLVWRTQVPALIAGMLEPLLYLLVLGVGVGGLVGDDPRLGGTYGQFVAAGLLGAAAMNAPTFETYNVFFKLRGKLYEAMGATPIDPAQIAIGEIAWIVVRVGIYGASFLAVSAVLGLVASPLALLAIPISVLIGFAFAAIVMAGTTYMRSWHDFDIIQVLTVPMFLFSATFYPLDVLPGWAQIATRISPLYHGVAALRQVMLAEIRWSMLGHLGILIAIATIGITVSVRRFDRLLRA